MRSPQSRSWRQTAPLYIWLARRSILATEGLCWSRSIALFSSQSEWVKNVLAAGGCELRTGGIKHQLSAPKVVRDRTRRQFLVPVRLVLRVVGTDEYMELSIL
jgi:hypothetical protein